MIIQLVRESCRVQSERFRGAYEAVAIQRVLMLEKILVHVPEPALGGGHFRRLGGQKCIGMQAGVGEMPEHVTQPITQALLAQSFDAGVSAAAVTALIVAVFNQRDRRLG